MAEPKAEEPQDVSEAEKPSMDPALGADAAQFVLPPVRHSVPFAVGLAGSLMASYIVSMHIICNFVSGDKELTQVYHSQVPKEAYQWPMVAFGTAFVLNLIMMTFETDQSKFQLALLTCCINLQAFTNDYLSWRGAMPVMRDAWGNGIHICRMVMWLHSTPAMVYTLSIISDYTKEKVYTAMAVDVLMLLSGIAAVPVQDKLADSILMMVSFVAFGYLMLSLWGMFKAPIDEVNSDAARKSLMTLRGFTVGLWFTFPVIKMMCRLGLLNVVAEEWLWTVGDFLGKVMFSSSLMHGNFSSIEQRRLAAMRAVEEANRVQVIQELKELIEQKERFMSGMSHELRTPLNGIIGLSEALMMGSCGQINEAVTKTINTIKTSGSRLLNLINDILDAATMRQSKGKLIIKNEKVQLSLVVQDVISLCQPLAKRGVKMLNRLPSNMPPVVGDSGRLIQIFHNLIGNSCKFTHHGHISIAAARNGDEVEVSVNDTGIGIPEEKFDAVFQAFEQVDMSTTRKYGGTGLGLNLVKQLVEAHQGSIGVRSQLGTGTTFFFTLKVWNEEEQEAKDEVGGLVKEPVKRKPLKATLSRSKLLPHAPSGESTKPSSTSGSVMNSGPVSLDLTEALHKSSYGYDAINVSGPVTHNDAALLAYSLSLTKRNASETKSAKGRNRLASKCGTGSRIRVLSVDDDPVNQLVIQNLLNAEEYEITQAMDGLEALHCLQEMEELPDVILLDVMMPGISGYEVCKRMRELFPHACVPVIMISAKGKEENIVQGLNSGSNDYMVKPFGRQEILARIQAQLRFRQDVLCAADTAHEDELSCLAPLMKVPSLGNTLPPGTAAALESGSGINVQMFHQITMLAIKVTNAQQLASECTPGCLAIALTQLHIALDKALTQYSGYCVDDPAQNHITILTGLRDEEDQVVHALGIAQALMTAARQIHIAPDERGLVLAASVHRLPAQGVVVGTTYPVMQLTGQLPAENMHFLEATPPGSILLSAKAHASLPAQQQEASAAAYAWRGEMTYLYNPCDLEADLQHVSKELTRIGNIPKVNVKTHAKRLQPFQRVLMQLALQCPASLVELGRLDRLVATPEDYQPLALPTTANQVLRALSLSKISAAVGSLGSAVEPAAAQALTPERETELLKERDMLQRQLDEVSEEAIRLADEVDTLTEQLESLSATQSATKVLPIGDPEDEHVKGELRGQVASLQAQLLAAQAEARTAKQAMADSERRLVAIQDALVRLYEAQPTAQSSAMSGLQSPGIGSCVARGRSAEHASSWAVPKTSTSRGESAKGMGGSGHLGSHLGDGGLEGIRTQTSGYIKAVPFSPKMSLIQPIKSPSIAGSIISAGGRMSMVLPPDAYNDITVLLEELGLPELLPRFLDEQITPSVLPHMDEAALRDLGVVSLGARLKVRMACAALSQAQG